MNDVIKLTAYRPQQNAAGEAHSSVAVIMAHVHRLAEQARTDDIGGSCSPQFVRRVIAARAARRQFFGSDLFADPAWDILLELYALESEQRRTSVSKLCIAAAVPPTTALRWIDRLHTDGLIVRSADHLDGRRVWVSISPSGLNAMKSYLKELSRDAFRS